MGTEEPSIADSLSAVYDELMSADDNADENNTNTHQRDDNGRFTAASDENNLDDNAADDDSGTVQDDADENADDITDHGESGEDDEAGNAPIEVPTSWSAEAREMFSSLPPETQEYIARRESERETLIAQKSQEIADAKKRYENIDDVITPRLEAWKQGGQVPEQMLQQLFNLSDFAFHKPVDFVKFFMEQQDIDLSQLNGEAKADDKKTEELSPEVAPLANEIKELKKRIQDQDAVQQAAQNKAVQEAIDEFRGNEENKYATECWNDMVKIIPVIKADHPGATHAELLSKAYEKAIWSNPEVRAKILADEKAEAEKKRVATAKQNVAKAKKSAGARVAGKGNFSTTSAPPASMRESMERAYEELQKGA